MQGLSALKRRLGANRAEVVPSDFAVNMAATPCPVVRAIQSTFFPAAAHMYAASKALFEPP